MDNSTALRAQLAAMLSWDDAHVTFDSAVAGLSASDRCVAPTGSPHTAWQLVEHLRITQRDILDFCRDPAYTTPDWPADYWPSGAAPADDDMWEASIDAFIADRLALTELALDESVDLCAAIPHGTGQTYLREFLLVADHSSYHVGQLVTLRRQLGAWPMI